MIERLSIRNRYKTVLQILLLVICVFSYVFHSHYLTENGQKIANHMELKLEQDDVLLQDLVLELQEILITNGKESFQKKALEFQDLHKGKFAFYLYHNDSLTLWTDNHIPLPSHFAQLGTERFAKFGAYKVITNIHSFHQFKLVYLQILKLEYPWQNLYLKDHLADYFGIDSNVELSKMDGIEVKGREGEILFRINTKGQNSSKNGGLSFFLFILSFFLLYKIISDLNFKFLHRFKGVHSLFLMLSLSLWYFIHSHFSLPLKLFESDLFSSGVYASGVFLSNLGNLFFGSLIVFFGVVHYVRTPEYQKYKAFFIYIYTGILFGLLYLIVYLLRSLVFDSQILLDLYQLASLDLFSYLTISIIFILQLIWILLSYRWIGKFYNNAEIEKHLWMALIVLGLIPLFIRGDFSFQMLFVQLMGSFGILLVFYLRQVNRQQRLMEVIVYIIFFTLITALVLNDLNRQKERLFRQTSAMNLGIENDPYLESHFLSKLDNIQSDLYLQEFLNKEKSEEVDDSLKNYVNHKYFESYLDIYNINLIHCDEMSLINIMPENVETSCYQYFRDRTSIAKDVIKEDVLYLVDGGFEYRNYIGQIHFQHDSVYESCIFIEFVSKVKQQQSGLPAILEKSHSSRSPIIKNYSYAFFSEGVLIDWSGKFDYKQKLSDYQLVSYHDSFFVKDDFQHYVYTLSPENVLIISLEKPGVLQRIASFAFVFLFYSLLTFLLYTLFKTSSIQNSFSNFQGRLQYSMIILLLFSFVLIGVSSLYYIIFLNQQKNADSLLEKAHSVLIELEHKLSGMEAFNDEDQIYVESLLSKFSEVFFTDITLYSRDGSLLASSRPKMFESELLAKKMNAEALYQLSVLKNSFYIHDEQIGTQKYLSAYLPFRNQNNKSVAYLNLPYFAKQFELEEEVSGFIVAFLNIYLFLLFIAILITVLISRYLSRPLLLVKEKISKLNLQKDNEKIVWNKQDEIGELIKEYNRMVDELEMSAKKLALSQRESAWREMAQQIAHEIKNPLTPMKLNVQYLERAWDDQVEDYEDRMKRITKGLKEQIDVLSDIAGQFSSFAAIEKTSPEVLEMKPIIESVMAVFTVNENITFNSRSTANSATVFMDKTQLIRVLNNIYKNAVQSLTRQSTPRITTVCTIDGDHLRIDISDNGIGIPEKEISRIFEPKFTTKSSGMGLGLALVKKMLENANATIEVVSEVNMGSTFSIFIPLVNRPDRGNTNP